MDDRLSKALEFSNYRITIENQKKALKARVSTLQTFMHQEGVWTADLATISFIHTLISSGETSSIIQDTRGNPVQVDDLAEFLKLLISTYNMAMNELSVEFNKLSKARNIKKLMDW